jgi:hypothetical protein
MRSRKGGVGVAIQREAGEGGLLHKIMREVEIDDGRLL